MQLSDRTRVSLPLALLLGLLTSVMGVAATVYGIRDQGISDIQRVVRAAVSEERAARERDQKSLVSREELLALLDQRLDRLETRILDRIREMRK